MFISESFAGYSRHVNHYDDTLGSVGDRGCDGPSDLECVRSKFIVNVEAKSRHDEIELQIEIRSKLIQENWEHLPFSGKHYGKKNDESENLGHGKLINPIREGVDTSK